MKKSFKRTLACLLVAVMAFSVIPLSAFAAETDISSLASLGMTVISDDESTLAPGVTMNEVVLYDSNGDRVEMYVTTSDTSVDTVEFYANYKDNQCATWGMQTLSEQVAAIEANYEEPFKVVAGLNASYYNTTNGAPTGAFVMEGVDMSTSGDSYSFFAVLKDGTVMIGSKGEYSSYKGQIKEAIGGYIHLVKDGAVCAGLDKVTKYPRQTVGITADGRVITMTADGSQAPKTIGLTVQEQAEVMLAFGCVEAIHLDGGNSATFGAIREGSEEFETVNTPSGQAERAVSNTLMIVSTAVADGTFDHSVISSDYNYYVPGSVASFTAIGVDATNAPAEIPENVTWTLSDSSFGTISDGTFVSNGTVGSVDVQMVCDGKVVGSKTIEVVHPESITFGATEKTVPYGKTSSLAVTAMYNNNEVFCTADDFDWTVANTSAGTLNGFNFTATTDETITGTTVSATYKQDPSVASTSVAVKFGKGSEVLFNFEDGDISDWKGTDTIDAWVDEQNAAYAEAAGTAGVKYEILNASEYGNGIATQNSSVFLASKENGGQVKTGDYALGVSLDRLNASGVGSWLYNYLYYTGDTQVWRDVKNGNSAVRVGMWVYFPQEAANTAFRICRTFTKDSSGKLYTNYDYMKSDYDGKNVSYNTDYAIPEAGWVYVYFDLTAYDFQSSTQYNPNESYGINNGKGADGDYYPAFIQFINGDKNDTMANVTLYIDDITLDYSDVIDDRDAPTITDAKVSANIDNYVGLNGQTVTNNCLSFMATVAEVTGTNNYTGLDYSSAKIYIDGMDVSGAKSFVAKGSTLGVSDVYLNNGEHEIVFEIADIQGNVTKLSKTFTVAGTAGNAVVSVSGHNDLGATPKAGSVYYVDVTASDASQVKSIVTTLKLNSANTFEPEHIVAADGVDVTYEYDSLNCEVTLNITNNSELTGEATLASVPVRVWAWDEEATGITATSQFNSGKIPVIDIECESVYGSITYADGVVSSDYISGFYSAIDFATELDNATAWHAHTAVAVDDVAATCLTDGYTGRTYCEGCASVVDWGITVSATGHNYVNTDGVLKCEGCGELYNGVYTDGKTYVDGVVISDGWNGDSYYVDGVVLTGIQCVDGYYYNFGDDGVCKNQVKYTGLFFDTESSVYRYAYLGEISTGWKLIGDDWYYFRRSTKAAATGAYDFGYVFGKEIVYFFDETGCLTQGVWYETDEGTMYYYGPSHYTNGWETINGKSYYFMDNYRYEGIRYVSESFGGTVYQWYDFGEDGAVVEKITSTGCIVGEDGPCYVVEGKTQLGLFVYEGDYYYRRSNGRLATGTHYVSNTNGLMDAGSYDFDENGKMMLLNGIVEEGGVLYYYVNNVKTYAGLINIDGDYYYVRSNCQLATGSYFVGNTNGLLPVGVYEFGADGKMLQGLAESEDGIVRYYVNGVRTYAGLTEIDGDIYYIRSNYRPATGAYYVGNTNGLLPAGVYEFGDDGKMLQGLTESADGIVRYYVNGVRTYAGLTEINGDIYYIRSNYRPATGTYHVNKTNGLLPAGTYEFGADGKLLQGLAESEDGIVRYYVNGVRTYAGLIEINGDIYYIRSNYRPATGTYYVNKTNGLMPVGTYEFDDQGRMITE